MLTEIDKCWQTDKPDKEKAENCFWISHHYCYKIKKIALQDGFSTDKEEIDFFRNVKPQFTCFNDYYVILSESLMFVPPQTEPALDFWNEEAKRFKRFCIKHNEFIKYYESDTSHMNDQYFLRRNVRAEITTTQNEGDKDFCTNYDLLLGNYLAQKKYLEYILCRKHNLNLQSGNP